MIIHSIHGENLFRFATVQLDNLPHRGVIAIDGANEAGKSSLLELLLLALFGRTSRLNDEELARAVRWGSDQAMLSVVFSSNDQQRYRVVRYLNSEGVQSANLSLAEEPTPPLVKGVAGVNSTIVQLIGMDYDTFLSCICLSQQGSTPAYEPLLYRISGVAQLERVADELSDEVIDMATDSQNSGHQIEKIEEELEDLDVMGSSLETMQRQLEEAFSTRNVLEKQIRQLRSFSLTLQEATRQLVESPLPQLGANDELGVWQKELEAMETAMDGLDRLCRGNPLGVDEDPSRQLRPLVQRRISALSELYKLMTEIHQQGEKWRLWLAEEEPLHIRYAEEQSGETSYPVRQATLQRKREQQLTMQRRSGWLFALALILSTATVILWYIAQLALVNDPGITTSEHGLLMALLGNPQQMSQRFIALLTLEGSIALLAGAGVWFYTTAKRRVSKQLHALEQQAKYGRDQYKRLNTLLKRPMLSRFLESITLTDAPWSEQLNRWFASMGDMFIEPSQSREPHQSLRHNLDEVGDKLLHDRQQLEHRLERALTEHESLSDRLDQLDRAIREENERRERDVILRQELQACHATHRQQRHGVRVREISLTLLQGAQKACHQRFQQELKRSLSALTPHFTGGHYRHLELDEEMQLQTRSTDHHGLVAVADLSSGTQRQMQLVLRLTLARAMAAYISAPEQLIVLDEPFAFFDHFRTQQAMHALCQLQEPITQIWVATQTFPEVLDEKGLIRITCDQDQESLIFNGKRS
ncbi:ATPase involved in DNA repair-like protein [Magnetococcus marinus MC-1]|uniref:ATPase involved in DNA repair-like protein n=1 Tax=Magnetococcus marinus (strain ATCC BAA-1437 / JCM 17883 / MC-1) TaxID=156889 RepID=A0LCR2_MAGMM|nr:AAA family ATPase [Magnetococcus marinus]ABK45755.1 ATPase involved in DNA repair-like protein [Magnetococcus marinus MC-1]